MGKADRKTKRQSGVKEIVFDASAQREFITGFRKRKNERRQFSRQKIAEEVRQERIKERKERRDYLAEQRAVGTGVDEGEEDADEEEAANAELHSFLLGGTLTTTVVTPLIDSDEQLAAQRPVQPKAAHPDQRPKKKKFNLSVPLATAIPGYKKPEGLKKKKKKGSAKKIVSKKDKARARAPRRET